MSRVVVGSPRQIQLAAEEGKSEELEVFCSLQAL